jgi:hypothetical protein
VKPPLRSVLLALALTLFPASAFAEPGADLFRQYCLECHGEGGRGGKGPALNKEGLLRTVGTAYLINSITLGRTFLGCPSYGGSIPPEEIKDIAVYIKGWQKGGMLPAPEHDVEPKDRQRRNSHALRRLPRARGRGCDGPAAFGRFFIGFGYGV